MACDEHELLDPRCPSPDLGDYLVRRVHNLDHSVVDQGEVMTENEKACQKHLEDIVDFESVLRHQSDYINQLMNELDLSKSVETEMILMIQKLEKEIEDKDRSRCYWIEEYYKLKYFAVSSGVEVPEKQQYP